MESIDRERTISKLQPRNKHNGNTRRVIISLFGWANKEGATVNPEVVRGWTPRWEREGD